MIAAEVKLDLTGLTRRLPATLRRPLMATLGKRLEVILRQHFRGRDAEPNKRGWPKQHFWLRIRRATALSRITDREAAVSITDPAILAKIHGATIRPVEAGALAIPIAPEAYGKRPGARLIPGVFMVTRRDKPPLLVRKVRSGAIQMLWVLLKRVTVPPDPEALPDMNKVQNRLASDAERFIQRHM